MFFDLFGCGGVCYLVGVVGCLIILCVFGGAWAIATRRRGSGIRVIAGFPFPPECTRLYVLTFVVTICICVAMTIVVRDVYVSTSGWGVVAIVVYHVNVF